MIEYAAYIWNPACETGKDSYWNFRKTFLWNGVGSAKLQIAADSTYCVWINGVRCPIAQVADMPGDWTYSVYDVSRLLRPGKNLIAVEVHYLGEAFLTYRPGTPFLRAAISTEDGIRIVATDDTWRTRQSPSYTSGLCTKVSGQLGYVFAYDSRLEDDWKNSADYDDTAWQTASILSGTDGWKMSLRAIPQLLELPRPDVLIAQKGILHRTKEYSTFALSCMHDSLFPKYLTDCFCAYDTGILMDGGQRREMAIPAGNRAAYTFRQIADDETGNGYYITLDLQRETVGFLCFRLNAPEGTVIDIAHGEHLADGRCRASVGGRSFADRYISKEGMNEFLYTHRRLGGRYVELHILPPAAAEISLYYAGMIPLEVPLPDAAAFESEDRLLKRVLDVSARTLNLCMHEHYEDCPWREQGLYPYDSRNQILYGYYVWGNYDYAGACLDLLGKSFDGDRYLSLTSPGITSITIPVFTLVWITEICEHWLYSGKTDLFKKWSDQIDTILDRALADTVEGGLYQSGNGSHIWNFCEWNGTISGLTEQPQAPFNIYLYESLRNAARMHREIGGNEERADQLEAAAARLGTAVEVLFWNTEKKIYDALKPGPDVLAYEHIQAIMLANGLVPEEKKKAVLEAFYQKRLRQIDLSALRYFVCAMIGNGKDARKYLTDTLREILEPIVLSGATSLWETVGGNRDFSDAGSLCHGWSGVMPFFTGSGLLGVTPLEPGFRKFLIKPYAADMTHCSGEVPTPLGRIRVEWKKTPSGLTVKVKHPAGTEPVLAQYEECPVALFEAELS